MLFCKYYNLFSDKVQMQTYDLILNNKTRTRTFIANLLNKLRVISTI